MHKKNEERKPINIPSFNINQKWDRKPMGENMDHNWRVASLPFHIIPYSFSRLSGAPAMDMSSPAKSGPIR